jgi:hypothetical protein
MYSKIKTLQEFLFNDDSEDEQDEQAMFEARQKCLLYNVMGAQQILIAGAKRKY